MTRVPETERALEAAQNLLPWYVNGTLEPGERALVERELTGSAELRADLALERSLAEAVASEELETIDERAGWSSVLDRLEGAPAEQQEDAGPADPEQDAEARVASATVVSLDARRASRPALRQAGWLAGASAIAATIAALVWWQDVPGPSAVGSAVQGSTASTEPGFVTVTTPEAINGPALRVQAAPGVAPETVRALAEGQGLVLAHGPTDAGVYTLTAPSLETLEAAAAALVREDAFLFVTVRRTP
ncbi:MAG: hypothetical protein AAF577_00350 [Pseudomonadota bacterium]